MRREIHDAIKRAAGVTGQQAKSEADGATTKHDTDGNQKGNASAKEDA